MQNPRRLASIILVSRHHRRRHSIFSDAEPESVASCQLRRTGCTMLPRLHRSPIRHRSATPLLPLCCASFPSSPPFLVVVPKNSERGVHFRMIGSFICAMMIELEKRIKARAGRELLQVIGQTYVKVDGGKKNGGGGFQVGKRKVKTKLTGNGA
ncbi:uncharacterized protein LOC107617704 [Arachis ipaensis]|uniref:uncharacterized protein LOC107617704 n=1 Tax=Arachis ipaensis TaxID=130454 RepID=UPI0007AF313D|nr:uncharacterized protein LOC107617704 [Arachis ipaensis]